MKLKRWLFLCLCTAFVPTEGYATVHLPAIIGNNMVLQQHSEVPLWGSSSRGGTVKVRTSWNGQSYSARCDAQGRWHLSVRTPRAGGPYRITFDDGDLLSVSGVLIGEVWVCSGQSNMEIPMKGYQNTPILHADRILMDAADSSLRLFHVARAVSVSPLEDCKGTWEMSGAQSAATFSAVGFQFARKLQSLLGVPVGIIETSWGGTPIQAWMNGASLAPFGEADNPGAGPTAHSPSALYNAMVNPIAGYGIKGFLWYQGEANRTHPSGYARMMEAMVGGWRKAWHQDSLPFYFVQIAPYLYGKGKDSVAYLREQQALAASAIPRSGMVVTMDVGSEFTIHPPDKTTVAMRLLYWALGDTYGRKGIAFESPSLRSTRIDSDRIIVTVGPAPMGLTSYDRAVTGFELAGKDHIFYPATARIAARGTVVVRSDRVPRPVAVRYGFKDWISANLFSNEGLPVAPFRSDAP